MFRQNWLHKYDNIIVNFLISCIIQDCCDQQLCYQYEWKLEKVCMYMCCILRVGCSKYALRVYRIYPWPARHLTHYIPLERSVLEWSRGSPEGAARGTSKASRKHRPFPRDRAGHISCWPRIYLSFTMLRPFCSEGSEIVNILCYKNQHKSQKNIWSCTKRPRWWGPQLSGRWRCLALTAHLPVPVLEVAPAFLPPQVRMRSAASSDRPVSVESQRNRSSSGREYTVLAFRTPSGAVHSGHIW